MKSIRVLCLILTLTFVAAGLKSESERDSEPQTQSTKRVEKYIYKHTPQGELAIHVHFPKDWTANDKRPAIVFFFGGGWRTGKVEQFLPQAEYLARRGMLAARADYRVRDRHGTMPDKCVEDGKSAVRWLRANAAKLGIDPNRITASGQSAGGHVAACTYTTKGLEAEGEDLSVSSKPNLLVLFEPASLHCAPDMSLGLGSEMAIKISPYHNLSKEVPPAFLFYGTDDVGLVATGVDFIEKSKKLGTIAELYIAEGQPHGFSNRSPWLERTIYLVDKFLARYGYTRGEPTIKLPEGKVEMKNMSGINLYAYSEDRWGHTPLHRAARHGYKESVELLIADGAEVNAKNKWGFTPLHRVARYGHKELVELLIANGADVNAKDKWGYTPLPWAIWNEDRDTVKLLVDKGADVNYTPKDDSPPLHYAVLNKDKDMVELLVDNGAKFDVKDQGGWTALHSATRSGYYNIVELLITKGADLNVKDKMGKTPLLYAKERGYKEIVELLRKHGAEE